MGGAPDFLFGEANVRLNGLPIPLVIGIPRPSRVSDRPLTVAPDIPVPLTGADYFGGRDAALEAILGR